MKQLLLNLGIYCTVECSLSLFSHPTDLVEKLARSKSRFKTSKKGVEETPLALHPGTACDGR